MFFNDALLSRRNGPLAKVWLASHMGDRKLSKSQLLGTSIPKSVGAIMGSDSIPLALRLSGQLLLGVARIYSRKAKFLVDDCNDALTKLRMTFRPGATTAVDMTAEQIQVSKAAITRQDKSNAFDMLYQDIELDFWDPQGYQSKTTPGKSVAIAKDADITRRDEDDFEFQMPRIEFGDDLYGGEGEDIELDLLGEDGPGSHRKRARDDTEEDISIEIGRDAVHSSGRLSHRISDSLRLESEDQQDFMDDREGASEGYGFELDYNPVQFGDATFSSQGDFDLSQVLDAHEALSQAQNGRADGVEVADGHATPRATSPTLTQVNGAGGSEVDFDVTPRTAKRVANTAALNSAKKRRTAAKKKGAKQIVDASTELQGLQHNARGGAGGPSRSRVTDPSLLVAPQFLPKSRSQLRLWEIDQDPAAYYLPRTLPNGRVYAGPPGLCPELTSLFEMPALEGMPPAKRARSSANNAKSSEETDLSIEMGRRDENGHLSDRMSYAGGEMSSRFEDDWDPNTLIDRDDFGLEGVDELLDFGMGPQPRMKSMTPAPPAFYDSRGATPLPSDLFLTPLKPRAPGEGMLGVFEGVVPTSESSQRVQTQEEERQAASSGWSKNTVRALRLLNENLAAGEDGEGADKMLSFETASDQATRAASAAFFFEMLVLGSRGCLNLQQDDAFGDISITAKPKMWEVLGRDDSAPTRESQIASSSPIRTPIAGR